LKLLELVVLLNVHHIAVYGIIFVHSLVVLLSPVYHVISSLSSFIAKEIRNDNTQTAW